MFHVNIFTFFEKNVYSATVGWNVLYMSITSIWPVVLFKSSVSLLIFCLEDVAILESRILKSPNKIVLLLISPFISVSIYFIYLDTPMFGT